MSSNEKLLLSSLLESSVIRKLMLEMTYRREEYTMSQSWIKKSLRKFTFSTHIRGYTWFIVNIIPIQCAYSMKLLNIQDLKTEALMKDRVQDQKSSHLYVKKKISFKNHQGTCWSQSQTIIPIHFIQAKNSFQQPVSETERLTGHRSFVSSS